MKPFSLLAAAAALVGAHAANVSSQLSSKQILPATFAPPQVFRHVNAVRTVNLEKGYVWEKIDVKLQNIGSQPESQYYLPFSADVIANVGGVEGRDKEKDIALKAQLVEFDPLSPTQFWMITLAEPLPSKTDVTISISFHVLNSLSPLPATIEQAAKQYMECTTSAYMPSAYETSKQRLKFKFPTSDVPDYTTFPLSKTSGSDKSEDPTRQGSTFTYGPYDNIPAGAVELVSVRYEYTKPIIHAALLEHDTEVSHWGGNLASEERFWMDNQGAALKGQFSRLEWQMAQYTNPPSAALKDLRFSLAPDAANAYFIDDIGNVSTSRFVPRITVAQDRVVALLDLKPRYPLFGGWKYKFRVGWDANLAGFLRKLASGEGYVLKVPFFAGPRMPEGVSYDRVVSKVILPEGATDVKWDTTVPVVDADISIHKTFMDTVGRTAVKLTALNLVDDYRDRDIIVSSLFSHSCFHQATTDANTNCNRSHTPTLSAQLFANPSQSSHPSSASSVSHG